MCPFKRILVGCLRLTDTKFKNIYQSLQQKQYKHYICNLSFSLHRQTSVWVRRLFQDRVTIYLLQALTQLPFCHREKGCPTANTVLCLCVPGTSLEKQDAGLGTQHGDCKFQQLCRGHLLPCTTAWPKAALPDLRWGQPGSTCTLPLTLNQWQQKLCWWGKEGL